MQKHVTLHLVPRSLCHLPSSSSVSPGYTTSDDYGAVDDDLGVNVADAVLLVR